MAGKNMRTIVGGDPAKFVVTEPKRLPTVGDVVDARLRLMEDALDAQNERIDMLHSIIRDQGETMDVQAAILERLTEKPKSRQH